MSTSLRVLRVRARVAAAFIFAALLSAAVPFVTAGCAAVQSETAATSRLAGIALPRGAERITDAKAVEESTAPLGTIAAGLDAATQMQATEVLGWGGAGYRRESGRQIIAQVQAALQKAGLQTQAVGEPQNVQGNTLSFFVAGSAQQRKALVGYWLEGEQLLMLVWGQFGRANAQGDANNSGGSVLDRVSSAPIEAPPRAATSTSMPTFPRLTAQPNQATGAVLNALGQPLAGARIRFWRMTPQGAILEYVARTNAQGVYSVSLPPAADYHVDNATALVSYGEQRYYLPLRPEGDDGSFFDRDAIDITRGYVKNFVLPVSGYISPEEDPKQELSYYGGSLYFRAKVKIVIPNDPDPMLTAGANGSDALPEGTRVQLTLTPQGPLLDGSNGRALSYNLQVRNTGRNAFEMTIKDIPLGAYTARARVTTPDGNTYTPELSARIVLAGGISGTFTTDAERPIFFAPRWEDWPMVNGNVDSAPLIKRSNKGGAGSVWLELGG
ncbi:MAG TPA: carboxypeptidase-like regulatory domain-containing protein [Pyrinomonadaceae bacterium]|nr:carboxypeptidase-like regulatory domain-containing protein [Pyrinomonadaceae bacterium]